MTMQKGVLKSPTIHFCYARLKCKDASYTDKELFGFFFGSQTEKNQHCEKSQTSHH